MNPKNNILKKMKKENINKRFIEEVKDAMKDEINTPEGRKLLESMKIVVICCFCENGITNPEKETTIRIGHSNQLYWCHKECLKSKMTEWAKSEFQEV